MEIAIGNKVSDPQSRCFTHLAQRHQSSLDEEEQLVQISQKLLERLYGSM